MEPKEKAKELILKFGTKRVALKVAEEVIKSSPSAPILSDAGSFVNDIEESTEWWKQVEIELKNLE